MRSRWQLAGWGILAAVFAGMSLYLILNPTRTGVVPNYRFASTHWWMEKSMYPGGTHGFLYVPQFAVLFSLIDWIRPLVLGEIVWRSLGFGMFAWSLWKVGNLLSHLQGRLGINAPTFTFLVLLAVPASLASLNNGQTNLSLSAVLVLLCLALRDGRWNLGAALLTTALILKPISVAPWLLVFAVFSRMRIPLLAGMLVMGLVGFVHPSPSYAWSQWVEFWGKLTHSYTPENLRVSDMFGMLEKMGFSNPLAFNSLTRMAAAGAALFFVGWKYRRGGSINGSWGLWVATALIWTVFNPRAETNSYVLISPLLAFTAVSYWTEVKGGRWKGAILSIACIGLMCDGMGKPIYLATDVWFKPLIVLLVSPLLVRMPTSWKKSS
jgi:hypothetical protein